MSEIDLLHRQKFEKVWREGDYRRGSTAYRLVDHILGNVPPEASINDYGCGTGRAEVEIRNRRPNQAINLIDIASNALEDEAISLLLQPGIGFFLRDLADLSGIPPSDWGLCINVLMTVQPDKLDQILKQIHSTCRNLFFEAYDMDDNRCGYSMTTVKLSGEQWKQKLMSFWPNVVQIQSPESHRRYIFVCKSE